MRTSLHYYRILCCLASLLYLFDWRSWICYSVKRLSAPLLHCPDHHCLAVGYLYSTWHSICRTESSPLPTLVGDVHCLSPDSFAQLCDAGQLRKMYFAPQCSYAYLRRPQGTGRLHRSLISFPRGGRHLSALCNAGEICGSTWCVC